MARSPSLVMPPTPPPSVYLEGRHARQFANHPVGASVNVSGRARLASFSARRDERGKIQHSATLELHRGLQAPALARRSSARAIAAIRAGAGAPGVDQPGANRKPTKHRVPGLGG